MPRSLKKTFDSLSALSQQITLDPVTFAVFLLDFVPDPWQAKFLRSRHKRMFLNITRQGGKSTISAVLALWEALFLPKSMILIDSPSLRQSQETMLKFQNFLNMVEMEEALDNDTKLSAAFPNGSRVVAIPGSEQTVRGFSAVSLIIEDEASRVKEELYNSTRPMLAVSNGRLILMSTPFGKRGHFFHIYNEQREWWEYYEIPVEMCPRISREFIEEERQNNPWFEQEYHNSFMESEDQLFKYDQILAATDHGLDPMEF